MGLELESSLPETEPLLTRTLLASLPVPPQEYYCGSSPEFKRASPWHWVGNSPWRSIEAAHA